MHSFKLLKTAALGLPIVSLVACGELPGFNINAKTDSFLQSPVRNDKIDILFVVDNSGSMTEEQQTVAESFEQFIEKFTGKKLNFQVGVISTDNISSASWWTGSSSAYADFTNAGPGSLLAYKTNERILTAETADIVNKFQQNSKLGTKGSGAEGGLKAATLALSESMLSNYNQGFVRSEALLAVIFVTDEDESRLVGANASEQSRYIRAFPTEAATRKENFQNRIRALKQNEDLISVTSVVIPSEAECSNVWENNDGLMSTGDMYMNVADEFKGRIIPICRDFSGPIIDLGADLVKLLSRFKLKQKPDGQIRVYVNGGLVERDEVNGWAYIAESNEVEFRGDAIPQADAKIEVAYVPGEPLR